MSDYRALAWGALQGARGTADAASPLGDQIDAALRQRRYTPAAAWDVRVRRAVRQAATQPCELASTELLLATLLDRGHSNNPRGGAAAFAAGMAVQLAGPVGVQRVRWRDPGVAFSEHTEWPVPPDFSVERVCRMVLHHWAHTCYWCGDRLSEYGDFGMLVGMGAATALFSTCQRCQYGFTCVDGQMSGYDFVAFDDWAPSNNWPIDRLC
ncbi:hypothetical protein [Lolliginicoccus levis]|uniref:hypothetical protein n=1 Tax=Lolliginicoccus levis TaxID=2919542 RepID=UPI00241FDF3E|nr:hypothetical protein [Lolliginicoccus levis]